MKHHWTIRLVAGFGATMWALCTLPACGDCDEYERVVEPCIKWPSDQPCPSDEATILAEVRKQDPENEYPSVVDTKGVRFGENTPECCYSVNQKYTDCGYSKPAGF